MPRRRRFAVEPNKERLTEAAVEFVRQSPLNLVSPNDAIRPELAGLRLYDAPVLGVAVSNDPLFDRLLDPFAVGAHFCPPAYWLDGAASVLSFFLPLSKAVRDSNRRDPVWPSAEWLHGRIEGNLLVAALMRRLTEILTRAGYPSVAPSLDSRFWSKSIPGIPCAGPDGPGYTSNWSERHVAHVCGLGTFGLSAGLITEKGIAGRFGSVVTALPLDANGRPYRSYDEYCTRCGACACRCPAQAISVSSGKNHEICDAFLNETRIRYSPRYGCGKCQIAVPCETRIPKRPKPQ